MLFTSIGDLSQSFLLRQDTARLKGNMQRLTNELSSGRIEDLRSATRGDLRPISALERSVALLAAFETAGAEAALFAEVAQESLAGIQAKAIELAGSALLAKSSSVPSQIAAVGREAAQQFEASVARLNVQAAGRSVFAGMATDGPALRPGSEILDALVAATAGATSAADVAATLTTWFGPGGGYETFAYLGSTASLRPVRVAEGELVDISVTALDPAIRDSLRAAALGALLDRGALAGNSVERAALSVMSGEALISANDQVVALRAGIGDSEAAIERARTRSGAERAAAEIARSSILSSDPYQASSDLLAVQSQLETLFTITGRLARLSLTNFLR